MMRTTLLSVLASIIALVMAVSAELRRPFEIDYADNAATIFTLPGQSANVDSRR